LGRIYIPMGDFLKNAGIVGMHYILDEIAAASEDLDYGYTEDNQQLWLDTDFCQETDWTDLYFRGITTYYRSHSVYQTILDKIKNLLAVLDLPEWDGKKWKDDIKFINDKLLSNSYKSGIASIKDEVDTTEAYELLKAVKLKESMEPELLRDRLVQLHEFLIQPICAETLIMKSAIYNYINRFWDGKCFLLRANAAKNMREVFENDFSGPFRTYIAIDQKKAKEICIDCSAMIDSKTKVSLAFMKDQADDLARKQSAFWNCKVDAFLCPVCAFVYALSPLGFYLMGNRFLFINTDQNIQELLEVNRKDGIMQDVEREDGERYTSWISRTLNLLLKMKTEELGNIQIITRGRDESERYTFDIINKNILAILNDEKVRAGLDVLSKYPYIKKGTEYINIHETVILNILRYRNQYPLLNILLRQSMDVKTYLVDAYWVYDIQIRVSLLKKDNEDKNKIGGAIVNRYKVRECGYELRNKLLAAKGTSDDSRIRGTVYRLLNAVAVGDVSHFMEIIMRIYCSVNLTVPDAFIECLDNREKFREYGYAFLMGLEGSHYEKKEEKVND